MSDAVQAQKRPDKMSKLFLDKPLLLEALLNGEELDEEDLKGLVDRNVKADSSEILAALQGHLREHHRFMIGAHLKHIAQLTESLTGLEEELKQRMKPYEQPWELLTTIPGVDKIAACGIIAEIGVNMDQFPSAAHLASWAGVCPGNNESAGKKKVPESILETPGLKASWLNALMRVPRKKELILRRDISASPCDEAKRKLLSRWLIRS